MDTYPEVASGSLTSRQTTSDAPRAQITPTKPLPYTQRTLNALMEAIELASQINANLYTLEDRHFGPAAEPASDLPPRPASTEGQMAYDVDLLLDALNRALQTSRRLDRI